MKRSGARIPRDLDVHHSIKRVNLPFTLRIARNAEQLDRAVQLRVEAYSRHSPTLGTALATVEPIDHAADTIVFLAESKQDGQPLGTIRIQTNFFGPLSIEESISLPTKFKDRPLAGVSRLAVTSGPRGRMVKLALFKAMHRYCLAKQVEWIVIGARPPLERDYERLGFVDLFDDQVPRPLASANSIPHRIMAFEIPSAERRWHSQNHPLYVFMIRRFHPDIQIFASVSNMWTLPRERRQPNPPAGTLQLNLPVV